MKASAAGISDNTLMNICRLLLLAVLSICVSVLGPAQVATAAAAQTKKADAKKTAPAGDLIDINSAPIEALKSLPGIGEAYSKKIIAGRPYANKAQLVSRKIIPSATYEKIKDRIIAKQK